MKSNNYYDLINYNLQIVFTIIVVIFVVIGAISSSGFAATDTLRYILIIRECNISSYYASIFEVSTYVISDIFRVIFFILFAWDLRRLSQPIPNKGSKEKKQRKIKSICILVSVPLIGFGLSFAAALLGYYRDKKFASYCHVMADGTSILIAFHAACKFFAYFFTIMICFCSIVVFNSSKCKWEEGSRSGNMTMIKWTPRPIVSRPQPKSDLDPTTQQKNLSEELNDKLYCLYNDYIQVGMDTDLERNALRRWFMVLYLIYIVYLLIHLVHIMKIISLGLHESILDILSAIMNILVHLVAFLFPYTMGIRLNSAHDSYHKKIADTYFGVEIEINGVYHLCKPGNYSKGIIKEKTGDTLYKITEPSKKMEIEKLYKEYFKEALRIQTNVITTKKAEFNFIPSFWSVNIPLDGYGYTFAVFLTVISIVLSFLQ